MEVHEMEGMFVGMLDDAEIKAFDHAVSLGLARRSYEGGGGFMGLAKVRLNAGSAVRAALIADHRAETTLPTKGD